MGLYILSVFLATLLMSIVAGAEGNPPDEQFSLIDDSPVMVSVDQASTKTVEPMDNSILQQSPAGNWESLLILAFTILIILGITVWKVTASK